jgi:hypothetical protein
VALLGFGVMGKEETECYVVLGNAQCKSVIVLPVVIRLNVEGRQTIKSWTESVAYLNNAKAIFILICVDVRIFARCQVASLFLCE